MKGKRLAMGALEDSVMEILWRDGGWRTPAQVHAELLGERDLRYTTVLTTLVRLFKKDRLERRKSGRAYAYHPRFSRSQWSASKMDEALNVATERSEALAHFLTGLTSRDRQQLRKLLDKSKRS